MSSRLMLHTSGSRRVHPPKRTLRFVREEDKQNKKRRRIKSCLSSAAVLMPPLSRCMRRVSGGVHDAADGAKIQPQPFPGDRM